MKVTQGDSKRKEWVFAVSLLCTYHVLANRKFAEFCKLVEKN